MACSLTDLGLRFSAAAGVKVTVKVIADNTKLVRAEYDGGALQIDSNISTTFTVAAGSKLLLLNPSGPAEDVEIVEDCGAGQTLHMFGYNDDSHPALGFTIIGE
jgi:hypothetical protein